MSQTSYSVNMASAFAGMLSDIGPRDVMSFIAAEAIPLGLGLAQGTADTDVKLPSLTGDVTAGFIGVSVSSMTKEQIAGVVQYAIKDPVPVLRKGRIWVSVEEAVTPASPVFVRFASGAGGSQRGAFRASADTATASQCSVAKYLTSASGGGLALLEVNMI